MEGAFCCQVLLTKRPKPEAKFFLVVSDVCHRLLQNKMAKCVLDEKTNF